MSNRTKVEVGYGKDEWGVWVNGRIAMKGKDNVSFKNKKDAIAFARKKAKKLGYSKLVIQNQRGKTIREHKYGSDSTPIKWNKVQRGEYKHPQGYRLKIMENPKRGNHPAPGKWAVRVSKEGKGIPLEFPQNFDSFKKAHKWAKEYMDSHKKFKESGEGFSGFM